MSIAPDSATSTICCSHCLRTSERCRSSSDSCLNVPTHIDSIYDFDERDYYQHHGDNVQPLCLAAVARRSRKSCSTSRPVSAGMSNRLKMLAAIRSWVGAMNTSVSVKGTSGVNQALRIGAFRNSPTSSLQVISSEQSLHLRRELVMNYTIVSPPPYGGGIKRCFCLKSVCLTYVCLPSVAYIGRNSRTERLGRLKLAQW